MRTHGVRATYVAGCRCDLCTKANRLYHRRLKSRPAPSHGESGYLNYGCRCDVCRAAGSVRNARRYVFRAGVTGS